MDRPFDRYVQELLGAASHMRDFFGRYYMFLRECPEISEVEDVGNAAANSE